MFNLLALLLIPQNHPILRVIRLGQRKECLKRLTIANISKQIVSQLAAVLTYKRQTAVFSACVGCQVGLDVVGCFQVAAIERAEFAHTVKRKITGDMCQKSCLGVILDHDSSGTLQLRQVIQDGRAGGEAKVVDEIYRLLFAEVVF